jgi:hypothetical protein
MLCVPAVAVIVAMSLSFTSCVVIVNGVGTPDAATLIVAGI